LHEILGYEVRDALPPKVTKEQIIMALEKSLESVFVPIVDALCKIPVLCTPL